VAEGLNLLSIKIRTKLAILRFSHNAQFSPLSFIKRRSIFFEMHYYALVNDGLEQTAEQEIKELLKIKAVVNKNVVEFKFGKSVNLQSNRRLLTVIGKTKTVDNLNLSNLPKEVFTPKTKFKILVEGVKGQENRFAIARKVAEQIYRQLKPLQPILELKKPDFLVVVFYNGEDYFIGVDQQLQELNLRPYRVFPHSASFRGDLAYHFVKLAGYKPGKKLFVGFCKDGILAIEASRYSGEKVDAFDEGTMNTTAARKNAKISKTAVEVKKALLEDLDVTYNESYFDYCIFQITTKDERKLNEIYHQAKYILKQKGLLLFIARTSWELSISDAFELVKSETIRKGDGGYKTWLLRKI